MNEIDKKYSVQKNKLIIDGHVLLFDYKIGQCVEVEGMLIVLLEKPPKTIYNENVFGVSLAERKIKWQIAKLKYTTGGSSCSFIEAFIFEGKLRLNNWCNIYLIVNPLTGEILERSRPMKY
jgi:hypothetical protein